MDALIDFYTGGECGLYREIRATGLRLRSGAGTDQHP